MLRKILDFLRAYWQPLLFILLAMVFVYIGIIQHWDKRLMAGLVLLVGLLSNVFTGIVALVAMIPFLGPLIIKVLSIPFFWILNALGYFVSVLFVKKGYGSQVVQGRVLTIVLLVGVVIGYVLGKIF